MSGLGVKSAAEALDSADMIRAANFVPTLGLTTTGGFCFL